TLDDIWELKGSYNQAVDTNDEIMFTEVNSKPALRILCSSYNPSIPIPTIPAFGSHSLMSASLPPSSHSGAHSRSQSISTTGAVETGGLDEATTRKSFSSYESNLISTLEIPLALTRQLPAKTLSEQYRRYLAITAALNKMKTVKSWPGKPPTEKEVIELVIGKSQWSKVWRPTFQRVTQYHSDMATWLNGD
ncbi:hypothetical protein FPV67DRAFT_1400191, partial [Lyophyllum atratum]